MATLISVLSEAFTLEPGDVIVTGTWSGVGLARKLPLWMKPGDVCEVELEGVGTLRKPVVDQRPMIEFMFETTRAVANMLLTGTFDRFPNIRLIVPHAGAAVPVLADRIARQAFHPRKAKQCSEPPPSDRRRSPSPTR